MSGTASAAAAAAVATIRRNSLVVCALAGCGRVSFASHDAAPDVPFLDASSALVVAPACGATIIDDTFDDGVAAPTWEAVNKSGISMVESGGGLEARFAPNVAGGLYSRYEATTTVPATDFCITAEVTMRPADVAGMYIKCSVSMSEDIEVYSSQGYGYLRTRTATTEPATHAVFADTSEVRAWRIRQGPTVSAWDVSYDGATFYVIFEAPASLVAPACGPHVGAGAHVPVTNAGVARWDRILVQAL